MWLDALVVQVGVGAKTDAKRLIFDKGLVKKSQSCFLVG